MRASPPLVSARTLFAWKNAVSPHLAAAHEGRSVSDATLQRTVAEELAVAAAQARGAAGACASMALVETAGGVCSPVASGTLQVLHPASQPSSLSLYIYLSPPAVPPIPR